MHVPEPLVNHLDKLFGNPTVRPSQSLQEVMYDAGKRYIVDYLKRLLAEQQKDNS